MAKTKKELGLDSMGIQKTMRLTDYLGDGLGQLPLNIMSCLVGQLTYFYTEKVGLAAGMVATMLLIAKVFDAFSDLAMGKIMDNGKSPKGKCRPWFSRMAIPALVSIILLFTVPKNMGSGLQAAFGYIAGMVIAILLIPITNMLGGTQSAWIKVAVIFGLISLLSLFILYKVSKENVQIAEKSEDENVPFVEGIKILFKNKYWVIMLALQFLMNISYSLSTSGGTYYAKYILGNDNIVALLGAVGLIPTFLGFILTGPMASKLGMTKTCMISCAMGAAACLVRVFTPYSLMTCVVGGAVTTFANIPLMCLFGPMVNNCVEYNDYKFGKRIVGMTNSANSFGMKIGSGIGASLIGWLLAAAGYNAALAAQPASVDTAIFTFGIYIPLALFVIMFILLMKNDLEKRYPEIMAELQKRETAK